MITNNLPQSCFLIIFSYRAAVASSPNRFSFIPEKRIENHLKYEYFTDIDINYIDHARAAVFKNTIVDSVKQPKICFSIVNCIEIWSQKLANEIRFLKYVRRRRKKMVKAVIPVFPL